MADEQADVRSKYRSETDVEREARLQVARDATKAGVHYDPNDPDSANLRIPGAHWWSGKRTVGEAVDDELKGKKSYYAERGISVVPDAKYRRLVDGKEGEFWTQGSTQGTLGTTTTRFGMAWSVEGNNVTYTIKAESFSHSSGGEGSRGYTREEKADLGSATAELPKNGQQEALFRYSQAVKSRVQDLGAVRTAEDHVATFEEVTAMVPFFHAVDNFQHGKPWAVSAGVDAALLFGPGILKAAGGAALRAAESTAQRVVFRLAVETGGVEADEAVRGVVQSTARAGVEVRPAVANAPVLPEVHSVGPVETAARAGPVESIISTPQRAGPLGQPEISTAPSGAAPGSATGKPPLPPAEADVRGVRRFNPNVASHAIAATAEEQLAQTVHGLPNQQVVRWGDPIGSHGSDVISVNTKNGEVTLWDAKVRSADVNLQASSTFKASSPSRQNAINEAIRTIDNNKTLPESVRQKALQNLGQGNVQTRTVGFGNAKNSVLGN